MNDKPNTMENIWKHRQAIIEKSYKEDLPEGDFGQLNLDKVNKAFENGVLSEKEAENAAQALDTILEKARNVKYYKRTGTPGNYKYYYTEAEYKAAKGGGEKDKDEPTLLDKLKYSFPNLEISMNEKLGGVDVYRDNKLLGTIDTRFATIIGRARDAEAKIILNAVENEIHAHNKIQGGKDKSEGKTKSSMNAPESMSNEEKAQFHREQMAEAQKNNEGHLFHHHMGRRDMYKELAKKDKEEGSKPKSEIRLSDRDKELSDNYGLSSLSKQELIKEKEKGRAYIERNPKNHSVVQGIKDKNELIGRLISAHEELDVKVAEKPKSDKSKIWGANTQ